MEERYTTRVWKSGTTPGYGGRREATYLGMVGGGRLPTMVGGVPPCIYTTPYHPGYTTVTPCMLVYSAALYGDEWHTRGAQGGRNPWVEEG